MTQGAVPAMPGDSPPTTGQANRWALLVLFALIVLVAALRWKFLGIPLDRDEGEFAYGGQLLLAGELPYRELHAMKMPGIYLAYAAGQWLWGPTREAAHLGLLVVNLASIALVYLIARRWLEPLGSISASITFATYTLCRSIEPMAAQAEHFVLLPALVGTWLVVRGVDRKSLPTLALAGLAMGTAFITKQHGLGFVVFAGLYLLRTAKRCQEPFPSPAQKTPGAMVLLAAATYTLSALVPLAIVCGVMARGGVFADFWFWTFTYPRHYASEVAWSQGLAHFSYNFARQWITARVIWVMAGLGLAAVVGDRRLRPVARLLAPLWIGSVLAIVPGLYFRSHYFVLVIPALALSVGCAIEWGWRWLRNVESRVWARCLQVTWVAAGVGWCGLEQVVVLANHSPHQLMRLIYGGNPFPESIPLAEYLAEHTTPADRIAIFGSEPQILFYAQRRSATPHIYTYPLMEPQPFALQMQEQMIADIEAAQPKFIVEIHCAASWMRREDSPTRLFDWFQQYVPARYEAVGVIDVLSEDHTRYVWGETARKHEPLSNVWIRVLQRRDAK